MISHETAILVENYLRPNAATIGRILRITAALVAATRCIVYFYHYRLGPIVPVVPEAIDITHEMCFISRTRIIPIIQNNFQAPGHTER
jgi:hypothetical protein